MSFHPMILVQRAVELVRELPPALTGGIAGNAGVSVYALKYGAPISAVLGMLFSTAIAYAGLRILRSKTERELKMKEEEHAKRMALLELQTSQYSK